MVETLVGSMRWLNRLAVALGGFLIFAGIMIIGVLVLVLFGHADLSILEGEKARMLSLGVLLAIGLLDMASGILLRRR